MCGEFSYYVNDVLTSKQFVFAGQEQRNGSSISIVFRGDRFDVWTLTMPLQMLAAERGDKSAAVNKFFHTILEDGLFRCFIS